jgi:long-chain acyl-CoA synthetase
MTGVTIENDPYATRPWLASYPAYALPDIDEKSYSTLVAMFRTAVDDFADRPAIDCFGKSLTYRELSVAAEAVGSWLQSRGLEKGDRVAIMSPNLASYPAVIYGVFLAGGVVVNINPLYKPHELEHQINDSGARFIFVLENFAHTVAEAWPSMKIEQAILLAPGDLLGLKGLVVNAVSRWVKRAVPSFRLPGSIPFSAVIEAGRRRPLEHVETSRDDIAFLQYTGGTTGVAKGAVLLHRNVASNVEQAVAWLRPVTNDQQIMITALPLYHIFGLTACCLTMARIGACCLMIPNPRDVGGFVKTLRGARFTMISGVNTLYAALAEHKDFGKVDFSALVFCLSGGMATLDATARKWKQITGKPIVEGYGLSETSPLVCLNQLGLDEFSGAIGYPSASTYVTLRSEKDGSPVPFGESGELCVKGPQVMAGYWKRPKDTAEAMTADGFFRTGDIALMKPDGSFKIVDRLKDMILVSGFNVYPNEIENELALHPQVKEVAVIGVPDPHSGEAPMAFVVPREADLDEKELREFLHERLTGYKRPKYYAFRDSLPKSTVGKILRRELRNEYMSRGAKAEKEDRAAGVA